MHEEISIFKNPALIGYLIKKMAEVYPEKQVGVTILQKLVYLLVNRGVSYFYYSMFHYGPASSEVTYELDYAENLDIVHVQWKDNKGYFILPSKKIDHFEHLLTHEEKKQVDQLVLDFGSLSAPDISILTSAIYLKTHFDTPEEELPQVTHDFKPKYSIENITRLLNNYIPKVAYTAS